MPQSLADLNVHYIFSTQQRLPLIDPAWAARLYEYLGGLATHRNCRLLAAGGTADHIHLLISIGRETASTPLMRELKGESSRWIHETFPEAIAFAWQAGYGAFSVSQSMIETVTRYIRNQEAHHAKQSFQDEYRAILTRHGVAWDERYVWD